MLCNLISPLGTANKSHIVLKVSTNSKINDLLGCSKDFVTQWVVFQNNHFTQVTPQTNRTLEHLGHTPPFATFTLSNDFSAKKRSIRRKLRPMWLKIKFEKVKSLM